MVPVNFIIRLSPLPLVSSELGHALVFFFGPSLPIYRAKALNLQICEALLWN